MAMIKVDTDQVGQVANNIDSLNNQLKEELEKCKTVIDGLASTWSGEAYNATKDNFQSFATQYFQSYYEMIDNYVKFLRTNIEQGYYDNETKVSTLAENFK